METEGTPNILSDLLSEIPPVGEHLMEIWEKLPDVTLAAEEGRLKERLLDIGSRLVALTEVRGRL